MFVMTGTMTPDEGSPLATAPIRPDREINLAEKYRQGSPDTQRLPRMRVHTGEGFAYTAYFPASGIRGVLRRKARDAVHDLAGQWDVETHRTLTIGGVKGSGSEPSLDLEGVRTLRKEYVVQSVFGQSSGLGASWVAGRLAVGFAVPETPLEPDIVTGVRTDDLARNAEEAVQFLTPEDYQALNERIAAERRSGQLRRKRKTLQAQRKARGLSDDEAARIDEELAEIQVELERLEDLVSADVSVLMPLAGYEIIPPGTPLRQRMVLHSTDLAEIGVLVTALKRFAVDPRLGAHAAQGCGIVRADWSVSYQGEPVGRLQVVPFEGLRIEGDALVDLCAQAEAAFIASVKASPLAR